MKGCTKQEAIDELIAAYREAFGEEPDNVTGMVISTSANRVVAGHTYEWRLDKGFRKLVWIAE